MKQTIRLTESKLREMIKEAVQNALNEVSYTDADGIKHTNQHGNDPKAWLRLKQEREREQMRQHRLYNNAENANYEGHGDDAWRHKRAEHRNETAAWRNGDIYRELNGEEPLYTQNQKSGFNPDGYRVWYRR